MSRLLDSNGITTVINDKRYDFRKIISTILTIVFLVLMSWFLYKNKEIFSSLKNLRIFDILIIALLQPISVGVAALTNKLIIDHLHKEISFSDTFLLQYTNNFLNKIVAQGGSVYRGGYLKAQYSFPLSTFLSSIGGVYIIGLMTNSIFGLLLLIMIYLMENVFNEFVLIIFILIFAGTLFLIIVEPKLNGNNWAFRKINQVLDGWNSIKNNRKLLLQIIILSILSAFSYAVSAFLAYKGIGADIKITNSILYSSISSIANFINLTPGGLGVNEAVLMFSSEVIGISSDAILLGALLLRAINLITSIILGGISYLILNYRLVKT